MSSLRPPKLAGKSTKLRTSKIPSARSSAPQTPSIPSHQSAHGHGGQEKGGNGSVDKVLFNKLVDMVPLVESLMDRKGNQSLKRRAAVVVTPTPANSSKSVELKGRRTIQTSSAKRRSDRGDGDLNKNKVDKDVDADASLSIPNALSVEDDQHDADVGNLRIQLDKLQKQLLEKEEALTSLKESANNINAISVTLNELKQQVAEKDSSIANVSSQLANTEIKLAEKQTALAKLEGEAAETNGKVEQLQENMGNLEFEIAAFKIFFKELSDISSCSQDEVASFQSAIQLSYIDDIDETWLLKAEDAREAYTAALTAAHDDPSDDCLSAVFEARLNLSSFLVN